MPETLSPRALCTLADVKAYLDPDDPAAVDATRDDLLTRLINAASSAIHVEARREFKPAGTNPQTRSFDIDRATARSDNRTVRVGDLAAFTTVTVKRDDGSTVHAAALADVIALPRVRTEWQPITRLRLRSAVPLAAGNVLDVTGTFGFPAVPEDIRQACIVTVSVWAARDISTFSDVFVSEEGRVELARVLPRQVAETVRAYRPLVIV